VCPACGNGVPDRHDARFPVDQPPDVLGYGVGLAMAMALLDRRRWPALTLSVIVLLWLSYHIS
jgi:hypothetical protein